MRAVNLIPAEERRGAGGAAGRSGGGVYVLLGTLALFVVMAAAYVVAGKNYNDKKAELARVQRDAQTAQAKAEGLAAYTRFSDLRAKRVATVSGLAASRFDWAHALREVSRVVPEDAWLTTLVGSVAPNVNIDGATTGAAALRGALPNPAVEVSGCTTSQKAVARMLTRMRLIDGVQRVSLASAEKADAVGASSSGGATSSDCRNGSSKFPRFDLVVFFKQPQVAPPPAGTPGAAPATGATGTAATASATPGQGETQAAGQTSTTPSSTTTTPSSSSQPASGGTTP